jgi:Cysteine-rich secretory protein family
MANLKDLDVDKDIEKVLSGWFEQHRQANASDIEAFDRSKSILEFLLMVNDRITRLGCAAVRFTSKEDVHLKEFLLVCNYSFANVVGEPIYKSGETACAGCQTGCSKMFSGLCSSGEAINP